MVSPYARYAAAFLVDQLNSVPSIHMRCRMTAGQLPRDGNFGLAEAVSLW